MRASRVPASASRVCLTMDAGPALIVLCVIVVSIYLVWQTLTSDLAEDQYDEQEISKIPAEDPCKLGS